MEARYWVCGYPKVRDAADVSGKCSDFIAIQAALTGKGRHSAARWPLHNHLWRILSQHKQSFLFFALEAACLAAHTSMSFVALSWWALHRCLNYMCCSKITAVLYKYYSQLQQACVHTKSTWHTKSSQHYDFGPCGLRQWERWKSEAVVVGTPLLSAGLRSAREDRSLAPSTFVGPPLAYTPV